MTTIDTVKRSRSGGFSSIYAVILLAVVGFFINWVAAYKFIVLRKSSDTSKDYKRATLTPAKNSSPVSHKGTPTDERDGVSPAQTAQSDLQTAKASSPDESASAGKNSQLKGEKGAESPKKRSLTSEGGHPSDGESDGTPPKRQPPSEEKAVSCPRPIVIGFKINSSKIDKLKQRALKKIILKYKKFLGKNSDSYVVIRGYSSPGGNEFYNLRLSYNRAESAAQLFYREGISLKRIKIKAEGSAYSEERVKLLKLPKRRVEISFGGVKCRELSPLIF